jgi:hypothetical protein
VSALSSRGGGGWGVQCVVEGSVCKCGGGGRGHGSEKDALLFQKRRTGWVAEQADTVSASCHCHCRGVRFKLTRPDAASPGPDRAGGGRWWLAGLWPTLRRRVRRVHVPVDALPGLNSWLGRTCREPNVCMLDGSPV